MPLFPCAFYANLHELDYKRSENSATRAKRCQATEQEGEAEKGHTVG